MINSVALPLSNFDLLSFIATYRKFCRKWSGDDSLAYLIVGIQKYGDTPDNFLPDDVDDEQQAIHDALVNEGTKVFFMMHEPPADDRFLCIDGKKRKSEDLDINLEDGYGFLLDVEGDKIGIHPALYDGSSRSTPQLTLQGTCSILEEPMNKFLSKFVRA